MRGTAGICAFVISALPACRRNYFRYQRRNKVITKEVGEQAAKDWRGLL